VPIPNQVTKVVLHGSRIGGEIWETGYWLFSSPTSTTDANALAQSIFAIHTGTGGLFTTAKLNLFATTTLDYVRVYSYPAGGPAAAFTGQSSGAPVPGILSAGTLGVPDQVAWVATFLTGAAGRSHRGRSYMPTDKGLLSSDGLQRSLSECTTYATAYAHDLIAITSTVNPYIPVVVSQKLGSYRNITQVRVDSRLDVQRRRANQQRPLVASSSQVIP
jgi:hypothetical protein